MSTTKYFGLPTLFADDEELPNALDTLVSSRTEVDSGEPRTPAN